MARPLRIEFPGAVYYMSSRGNVQASTFLDLKAGFDSEPPWNDIKGQLQQSLLGKNTFLGERSPLLKDKSALKISLASSTLPTARLCEPWQNDLNESFNIKFRDECLSVEWFRCWTEARVVI